MAEVKNTQENVNVNTNNQTPAPAQQNQAPAVNEPAKVPWYKKVFNRKTAVKALRVVSGFGLMLGAGIIGGTTAANLTSGHNTTTSIPDVGQTGSTGSSGDDGPDISQF